MEYIIFHIIYIAYSFLNIYSIFFLLSNDENDKLFIKSNFKKQINIDLEYIKIHMGFLKKNHHK